MGRRSRPTVPVMAGIDDLAQAGPLVTGRLRLEPLRVEHARELAPLLADPGLHAFTGGHPDTAEELAARYARQVADRSPDGAQRWLNWVVRRRDSGQAVGTVQATVTGREGRLSAEVAWVTATSQQQRGYAREAAQAMVAWLRGQGVEVVIAHVHPGHEASMAVARAVGLTPTAQTLDGEVRWQG